MFGFGKPKTFAQAAGKHYQKVHAEMSRKGGKARAANMPPDERKAAAKYASGVRWGKK